MGPNPRYDEGLLPSRASYPKQRSIWYSLALILCKCAKAFGLYLTYDLLKLIHIVPFLAIVKLGSAVCLLLLQRPKCRGLHRSQLLRLLRHAIINSFLHLLWLFGLSLCGPLRSILVFEQNPLIIIAATSAVFKNVGGPSKFRGAVFLILAILAILFFDHDDYDAENGELIHPEGHHNGIIKHTFYHLMSWSGLSDHKGGVMLLVITLLANVIFHNQSKKLALDLGGAKRVNALSTMISSMLLLPWAIFVHSSGEGMSITFFNGLLPFSVVIVTVFILDYYVEAVAANKMESLSAAWTGSWAIFTAGLILSLAWSHPFIKALTSLDKYKELITEDHLLSGGVVFAVVLMYFAASILTSSAKQSSQGSFIGYSSTGMPMYTKADEHSPSGFSLLPLLRNTGRQILEDKNSRSIFYFLLLNLSFTFVELIYGAWTNSLGLISDGFHMLFDCSALVVGLYASVMSRWKPSRTFSYGYDRVETLSGFVNGLFLVIVSFFILLAAVGRLMHPPHINTDRLLIVSVLGLLVNLFGIAAFSHAHTHGGSSHGHSHGGSHGHSHDGGESKNSNMRGVFLHVLADTLGSVGVIISTLLIQYFDMNIADPLCSMFIGVMIFISVIPLLTDTANVLLLRLPSELQSDIALALKKILSLEGVLSYRDQHFWRHSGGVVCGTLHIQIAPSASEQQAVLQATSILKAVGIKNLTLQIEKEIYYHHLTALDTQHTPVDNNLSYNSSVVRAI